ETRFVHQARGQGRTQRNGVRKPARLLAADVGETGKSRRAVVEKVNQRVVALYIPDFFQMVLARKIEVQTDGREDANLAALAGAEGVGLKMRVVRWLDAVPGCRCAADVSQQVLYGWVNRRSIALIRIRSQLQQVDLPSAVLEDALLGQRTQDGSVLGLRRGQ